MELNLTIKYFSILPGTLIGAFLLGYWMNSKGWAWGIFIPILSMMLASISHSEQVSEVILIYSLQIIPAGILGEIGNRMKLNKYSMKSQDILG